MAEGAPLLREYGVYSLIEGSNPSFSAKYESANCRGFLRNLRKIKMFALFLCMTERDMA